jgi:hypothetical protein
VNERWAQFGPLKVRSYLRSRTGLIAFQLFLKLSYSLVWLRSPRSPMTDRRFIVDFLLRCRRTRCPRCSIAAAPTSSVLVVMEYLFPRLVTMPLTVPLGVAVAGSGKAQTLPSAGPERLAANGPAAALTAPGGAAAHLNWAFQPGGR